VNYYASRTIDIAGIWVGGKVDQLQASVGEYLTANPAAALALQVAGVGMTVAWGPLNYAKGQAWDLAKGQVQSGITRGYQSAGWSPADSTTGANGLTVAGSVILGGVGVVKGGLAIGSRPTVVKGLNAEERGAGSLPVVFDGEFATRQLLGTTTTPGGRQIMFHAADRMVSPPVGRVAMKSKRN